MYLVSLIGPEVAPAFAEALRNAWGGGDAVWLDPDRAVEFALDRRPDNLWEVWAEAQKMRVDLCLQVAEGRRREVLLADMDSTMIGQECIDELADMAGVGPKVAAITERAMAGALDFEAALRERVGLLAGLDAGVIERVWAERITLAPGSRALVATMRANGARAVLVSGGFLPFTERVAAALGFDAHRANALPVADGRITGAVAEPVLGRAAKVDALREVCSDRGVGVDRAMAVGDGANDLGMLKLAGAGVALHAKKAVAAELDLRINHGDLTALLYLQGYGRDEILND